MDEFLTKSADALANWVVIQTMKSMVLAKQIEEGKYDLSDRKLELGRGVAGQVGHEFLFLYLHLADVYTYQRLKQARDVLQDRVVDTVLKNMNLNKDNLFISLYNERLLEYSRYQHLFADSAKGESPAGTLFWEFGKRISNLVSGLPDHVFLVAATQTLILDSWLVLNSSQLLNQVA